MLFYIQVNFLLYRLLSFYRNSWLISFIHVGYRFKPIRRRDKSPALPRAEVKTKTQTPRKTNLASPHKTRASTSSIVEYPLVQFPSSSSQTLSQQFRTPDFSPSRSQPQTQTQFQSQYQTAGFEGLSYAPYQSGTPAFYYDSNVLPTPPHSAVTYPTYPRHKISSLNVNMDPGVQSFLASLDSERPLIPNFTPIPGRSVFESNGLPTHIANAAPAWNEFENAPSRFFPTPPTPSDANFFLPPMSAPATTTTFAAAYPQHPMYDSYPTQHRASVGSSFLPVNQNHQKTTTTEPWSNQAEDYEPYPITSHYPEQPNFNQYEQQH